MVQKRSDGVVSARMAKLYDDLYDTIDMQARSEAGLEILGESHRTALRKLVEGQIVFFNEASEPFFSNSSGADMLDPEVFKDLWARGYMVMRTFWRDDTEAVDNYAEVTVAGLWALEMLDRRAIAKQVEEQEAETRRLKT